jgi:hypothetical protein
MGWNRASILQNIIPKFHKLKNSNKMSENIDSILSNVYGLKWLPWIGEDYLFLEESKRLLIIGESHYHENTKESIEKHDSITFTREVVVEMPMDKCYYGTKVFQNLHRALFGNDEFDSEIFWNLVAYYNFVQRPMVTIQGRPNYLDYINGWKTFFEIVKIIKPKTCLFIGTTAAYHLVEATKESGFETDGVRWEDSIGNAYAKTAIIQDQQGHEIKLVFIRHTSQMFSWSQWNAYLKKTIPSEIRWLEEMVYYGKV